MQETSRLPYITAILSGLERGDPEIVAAASRHMHWGYWPPGAAADGTARDLDAAAERLTRRACDAAAIKSGQRVLDAGCGLGGTVASLNERFTDMDLVGVNIDSRQIERARREVKARPQNRITFCEADACAMPLEDGSFDAILAIECIFHFPSRRRFFGEVRRLLKPGGRLVITDGLPIERLAPALDRLHALGGAYMRRISGPVDITFTLERYRALAADSGLTLTDVDDITRATLPTFPVLRRLISGGVGTTALFRAGVWGMEGVSRAGLVRYCILTFSRDSLDTVGAT